VQELQLTTLGKNISLLKSQDFRRLSGSGENALADEELNARFSHLGKFDKCGALAAAAILLFLRFAAMEDEENRAGHCSAERKFREHLRRAFGSRFGFARFQIYRATNANDVFPNYLQSGKWKRNLPSYAFQRDGCRKSVKFRADSGNFRQ
jgi:hypothetical protein